MPKHSHTFIENYTGIGAFGFDRATDEATIMYYLQKFSDDAVLEALVPRLSDEQLGEIHNFIHRLLKSGFSEEEYHQLFLKDRGQE